MRQADRRVRDPAIRERVWQKSAGFCWYCGHPINPPGVKRPRSMVFTVDHFIPKSVGGGNKLRNLMPSCKWCNNAKADKSVDEFRAWLAANGHPSEFWHERQAGG